MIEGLITVTVFVEPSEARRLAELICFAAYEAAELIPVPEAEAV
jgi:hypothetical protein